jgi:predicted nuclease with TOPRIM domain
MDTFVRKLEECRALLKSREDMREKMSMIPTFKTLPERLQVHYKAKHEERIRQLEGEIHGLEERIKTIQGESYGMRRHWIRRNCIREIK